MSALRYEVLPSKPTDHDPITVEEFTKAARDVLTSTVPDSPLSENREPIKQELNRRYKSMRRSK